MASIYEIEYLFEDELGSERESSTWRNSNLCVYETGTPSGDTIDHALELANEDGDFTGVDNMLGKMFGLRDDDIAFYFDRAGIEDESLVLELQHDFDIIINDLKEVDKYE